MITVILNPHCVSKLRDALHVAGEIEIGGVLAAEQIAEGTFRVLDISVQMGVSASRFVRDPEIHRKFIADFHERMEHQFERYNYIGEWHSHPNFSIMPSTEDFLEMQRLVEDAEQKSTFLALLVVRLNQNESISGTIHGFRPDMPIIRGSLLFEHGF